MWRRERPWGRALAPHQHVGRTQGARAGHPVTRDCDKWVWDGKEGGSPGPCPSSSSGWSTLSTGGRVRSPQVARAICKFIVALHLLPFRPKWGAALLCLASSGLPAKAAPTRPLARLRCPCRPQGSSLGPDIAPHCASRSRRLCASLANFRHPDPRLGPCL